MANVVDRMTERLLADAGLASGMRVLDIGCGTGVMSVMAARLVGQAGQVVGIDRNAVPLETARRLSSQ